MKQNLYSELESDVNQDIYLHIGTNDAGKVWVNGNLLIDYPTGRSAEPSQNIARVNLKKGKNTILLKIDQLSGDMGYPATVQLDDGSLITIYYQIDKKGEKTSLMQIHWQLMIE